MYASPIHATNPTVCLRQGTMLSIQPHGNSLFLFNVLRSPLPGMLPSLLFLTPPSVRWNIRQTSWLPSLPSPWWTPLGSPRLQPQPEGYCFILWIPRILHLNPYFRSFSIFYLVLELVMLKLPNWLDDYTHCSDEKAEARKINLLENTQHSGKYRG